jgi:hypothetical protein
MIERIKKLIKDYRVEMMDIDSLNSNFDLVSKNNQIILVDLIPPFLTPNIKTFDFDEFESENEMLISIENSIKKFQSENCDPHQTLVLQLIHSFETHH